MADASIRRRASGALAAVVLGLALASPAFAQVPTAASDAASAAAPRAVPTAADPVLEARMLAITGELRCLVCQNQTIADSHADLAVDLRQEVRELIKRGQTDDQIRRYMTDRYGDFVLYKPPFKPTTMVLWLGPALLLAVAIIALMIVIARRGRLADDRFEPDPDWDDDEDASVRSSDPHARPGAPA